MRLNCVGSEFVLYGEWGSGMLSHPFREVLHVIRVIVGVSDVLWDPPDVSEPSPAEIATCRKKKVCTMFWDCCSVYLPGMHQ